MLDLCYRVVSVCKCT